MSPSLRASVRRYVLDANALIGFFEGRHGVSGKVGRLLGDALRQDLPLMMSAVNWGEVFYMENFLGPFFLPYIQQGTLPIGIDATTKLQMIAVQDIGKYGAVAFEKHAELNGRALDIAGDELTGPEAAKALSGPVGHPLQFFSVPKEEVRKGSEDYALMLEWFDSVGYDVDVRKNVGEFGIRPTPLAEWAASVHWATAPAAR